MRTHTHNLGVIPAHPVRWLLLSAAGLAGAALFVVAVTVISVGPVEFTSAVVVWLDDHHVWGERTALLRAAKRFETADPVADALRAISAGDARLLSATGIGEFFPGLPNDSDADLAARYGVQDMIYAGCVVDSEEASRFRTAAYNYAERYNRAVVSLVCPPFRLDTFQP